MTIRTCRIVSIAFAVLVAGTAACGGGGGGSTNVTADQAAGDVASALCARYASCSTFVLEAAYGTTQTCASRVKLSVTAAMGASGTARTPANVEACAQAITSNTSCDDVLGNNLPSPCQPLHGRLADGTACFDSSQCQSAFCNTPTGQTCGACGTAPSAGDSCLVDSDCPPADVCAGASGAKVCAQPGAAGAACDTGHPCKATLACKSGTCGARLAAGQSCGMDSQACDVLAGAICNATTTTCAAITFAGAGQACGLVGTGYVACSGGGSCTLSGTTASGTCSAPAADGATCSATGPSCMIPATCTNGTCVVPSATRCM